MFRILLLILGFWILLFVPQEANATHIVGGNFTYRHISGDTYQVRLTLRRDCFLAGPNSEFDDPASIGIFTENGTLASWLSDGQLLLPFMASDTLNEYIQSDCGFEGTQVCVHETIYQAFVFLPKRPGGYILAYQRCCRNGSINNIKMPLETGSTYWAAITEESMKINNSSPAFKSWPDVYICANKPLVFDHSAIDINGDSLVYKLAAPNSGADIIDSEPQPPHFPPYDFIEWNPPYNVNDMMGGIPLKIDPNTGIMTATPNLVGQFLVGVLVEEYRNGVLLSTIRRDFQFNVRVCSQPPLAVFSTSESNCDGLTVEFYNSSLSASEYEWNFNYPSNDPLFKSTEKDPIFTFPSAGVYTIRLMSTRGTDKCFDTILQTVAVFDNKIIPNFDFALGNCKDELDSLSLNLTDISLFNEPGYVLNDWKWTVTQNGITNIYNGSNPNVLLDYNGDATVFLEVFASNGCKASLTKDISINDLIPRADFTYELLGCPENGLAEIKLSNLSGPLNPLTTIVSSEWTVDGKILSGNPLSLNISQDIKQFSVTLKTTFEGQCSLELTKIFDLSTVIPVADYAISPVDCPDDGNVKIKLSYIDTLSNGISFSDIQWQAGIQTNINGYNGSEIEIIIPKDSLLFFDLTTTYSNGCVDKISGSTLPGPFATINFVADSLILCPGETKPLIINGNPNWTYTWSPETGLDLTDPSNPLVKSDSNQIYMVTVTDGLCSVSGGSVVIALAGGITLNIESDSVSCDGTVTLNASGGFGEGTYTWGIDPEINQVIGVGQSLMTSFTGQEETYYVKFVGEACSTEPAKFKVTNQTPSIDDLSPFTYCIDDTAKILTLNLIPGHMNVFTWDTDVHIIADGDTSSPTIGIGPDETESFALFYNIVNQYGCQLRDSVLINIGVNPEIDFNFTLAECGEYKICFEQLGDYKGFIKWDFGDPATESDVSLEKTPCYSYPDGGTYSVNLINLVSVCPFKDVSKDIVINPQIRLEPLMDQVICKGDSLFLNGSSNLTDVEYQWCDIDGNMLVNLPSYATVINEDAKFIFKGKDIYGCTDADTVNVALFKFNFTLDVKDSLCINEPSEIMLNIDQPENYNISWFPKECIVAGDSTTQPVILGVVDKTIRLVLENKLNGCKDSTSFKPVITMPFTFSVDVPEVFCLDIPTTIILDIENPENYTFTWTPAECIESGANTPNPVLNIIEDKTVNVKVINKISGCTQDLDMDVKAGNEVDIVVKAEPDASIYEGESVVIYIDDPIKNAVYNWSTGENGDSIIVSPIETTTYTVTVTDMSGCTGLDNVTVTVRKAQCDETDVFIPNAFSPNGDQNNQIFRVRSNFIDEMDLIIYNRWGQEIFKTSDKNIGWDGTFNGQPVVPDAYAFYLRVLCVNAEEYVKRGNVTLLR